MIYDGPAWAYTYFLKSFVFVGNCIQATDHSHKELLEYKLCWVQNISTMIFLFHMQHSLDTGLRNTLLCNLHIHGLSLNFGFMSKKKTLQYTY